MNELNQGTRTEMSYANFGRRFIAFLLDVLPITLIVASYFYFFLGFDEAVATRINNIGDIDSQAAYSVQKDHIQTVSTIIWLLYCMIFEASPLQGTIGKFICGIKVVDESGNRLTAGRSISRNLSKIISLIPLSLGFIWAAFSKQSRAWHDSLAKTYVLNQSASN